MPLIGCDVQADPAAIKRASDDLAALPGEFANAMRAARKKTTARTRTFILKQLFSRINAPLSVIKVTQGGKPRIEETFSPSQAVVSVKVNPISGAQFVRGGPDVAAMRAKQAAGGRGGNGVFIKRWRNRGAAHYPKGFLGTGLGGNVLAFMREPGEKELQKKAHYEPNIGKIRQKLRALHGVSIFRFYKQNRQEGKAIEAFMKEEFPKQLESQVDRILKRRKAPTSEPTEAGV